MNDRIHEEVDQTAKAREKTRSEIIRAHRPGY